MHPDIFILTVSARQAWFSKVTATEKATDFDRSFAMMHVSSVSADRDMDNDLRLSFSLDYDQDDNDDQPDPGIAIIQMTFTEHEWMAFKAFVESHFAAAPNA